jgi:hypothetical protein
MMKNSSVLGASFRDPSGFLFHKGGVLFRQINQSYQDDYELLLSSGLYEELAYKGFLVRHEEVDQEPMEPSLSYKVIRPELIEFISHPYEWSFSQLKDAALRTLAIQSRAMKKGMSLKDASAYNIQFHRGSATLIDTLSFEAYQEGNPWIAYRQFCQHFLAPLALMAYRDFRLSQLLRVHLDGIPLDLASRLLPVRTRLNFGISTHIHLHASFQRKYASSGVGERKQTGRMSRTSLEGLVESLKTVVRGLKWQPGGTEWGEYYDESAGHYSEDAFRNKLEIVERYIARIEPRIAWDLGANTGVFSRITSQKGIPTVAFDIDPAAVERNYLACKESKETNLLPLVLDLTNPSPAIGWSNRERLSLLERGPADMVLALALVHHLAIGNNVPLERMAEFFHQAGRWLVIEFVPKEDSQVQLLLASRKDIFPNYTRQGFEEAFKEYFEIQEAIPVRDTTRMIYLMEGRPKILEQQKDQNLALANTLP